MNFIIKKQWNDQAYVFVFVIKQVEDYLMDKYVFVSFFTLKLHVYLFSLQYFYHIITFKHFKAIQVTKRIEFHVFILLIIIIIGYVSKVANVLLDGCIPRLYLPIQRG